MKIGRDGLQSLLSKNVVELRFVRRKVKDGWSPVRGMFATTNIPLLNSDLGKSVLNFKPPTGMGMHYDYKRYNLCVGWDFFRQEYRLIPVNTTKVLNFYNVEDEESVTQFWEFFNTNIYKMTNEEKLIYMGHI